MNTRFTVLPYTFIPNKAQLQWPFLVTVMHEMCSQHWNWCCQLRQDMGHSKHLKQRSYYLPEQLQIQIDTTQHTPKMLQNQTLHFQLEPATLRSFNLPHTTISIFTRGKKHFVNQLKELKGCYQHRTNKPNQPSRKKEKKQHTKLWSAKHSPRMLDVTHVMTMTERDYRK